MADEKKNEGAGIPPEAQEDLKSGAAHAKHAAKDAQNAGDDVRQAAQHAAGDMRHAAEDLKSAASAVAEEYRGRAEEVWNDARYRVRTFQEDSEQYVRENPTKAVFTALGVGFVLGLIFRR